MFLEAGDPIRGFYEKMGFRVVKTIEFVDPEDSENTMKVHLMTISLNREVRQDKWHLDNSLAAAES
jgi:hypothetical protein